MLAIEKIDHIGIRVSDKKIGIDFYESLGFVTLDDIGFEQGHPVIMQHSSGVVINLLGPALASKENILMDVTDKHAGITHVSFKVSSMDEAKEFLKERGITQTGEMNFKGMHAIFFRDPDLNVIELDAYAGDEPETRSGTDYTAHP
jgi:lactoylglutathione lyase